MLEQNAQLEAAKAAQAKIDQAKGKVFGIKDAMKAFEDGQSAKLRGELTKLKEDKQLNNVTED